MAACPLRSWMVAKEACHRILNCHIDDHWDCWVSYWDSHRDPHCGLIICFSWCWKKEEREEMCGAYLSWFKKAAIDKYEKINGVAKGNLHECRVNELKRCVKGRKCWYDWKHCRDASFYPVNDSMILASPATHISDTLHGRALRTRTGEWPACRRVVDWLPLMKIVITTT